MQVKMIAVAGLLGVSVSAALAQGLEFKGTPFGSPQQTFTAAHYESGDLKCDEILGGELGDVTCRLKKTTYAGERVEQINAYFYNDRLSRISLNFPAASFDAISKAMVEKYGKPSRQERQTVGNRFGARFENLTLRWNMKDGGDIVVMRFDDDLDTGSVWMEAAEAKREFRRRMSLIDRKPPKKDI